MIKGIFAATLSWHQPETQRKNDNHTFAVPTYFLCSCMNALLKVLPVVYGLVQCLRWPQREKFMCCCNGSCVHEKMQ